MPNGFETTPQFEQNTNLSLFSLLPFSEDSQLVCKLQKGKFLHLLHSIISMALAGLYEFQKKNLTQFDAQVSENLCQIRAYQITFLAQKYLYNAENQQILQSKIDFIADYQKKLELFIQNWNEAVKNTSSYDKNLDGKENIKSFLEKNSLCIEIKADMVYLITCYFLAHFSTKINGILQSISLSNVAKELAISKSQAKKIVHLYQMSICKQGLIFVQKIVMDLPELAHYRTLLPSLIKDSGDSRFVLPCFVVSEIIFKHALFTNTPIFLSVRRIGATLNEDEIVYFLIKGHQYLIPNLLDVENYLTQACVTIEAEVNYYDKKSIESIDEYIERLLQINPIQSLLANTAMHPQYAGENLKSLAEKPFASIANSSDKNKAEETFQSLRQMAIQTGCHKENSSTLYMKHAYADTISNQTHYLRFDCNEMIYNAYDVVHQRALPERHHQEPCFA